MRRTSLLLLVLLVGAAILAEAKKEKPRAHKIAQHASEIHDGPHPNASPYPHARKTGPREDWGKTDWKVEERVRKEAERERQRVEEKEWKVAKEVVKGEDSHMHPHARKMEMKGEMMGMVEGSAPRGGMEHEGRKEKGEGSRWRKHGDEESGEGHHWRHRKDHWKKFENLTMHFVERSLPVNVYTVLEDKGLQVKAAYGVCGESTVLTKLKIVVEDKTIVISANEKISINGEESDLENFAALAFENGNISKRHHHLSLKYGVYSIFIKVKTHGDCARVGVRVGVEKTAKVSPGGFIGQRIAVDPASYTSSDL